MNAWIAVYKYNYILSAFSAELYIRGNQAYLHRLGINPEVRHRLCEILTHNPLYCPCSSNQPVMK